MSFEVAIRSAALAITESSALLITAGAGMGVDSGLPDFRGNDGFWNAYPPYRRLNLQFSQLANPRLFFDDPYLAWGFYGHRMQLYRNTKPHMGFDHLLKWAAQKGDGYFVFTSNVDGQFHAAGFAPQRIVECHGSIHHLQCSQPCNTRIWSADSTNVKIDMQTMRALDPLPRCPECGSIARPNVLMFNDTQWVSNRTDCEQASYQQWYSQIEPGKLCAIECGAGIAIPTVRLESERLVRRNAGKLIRINVRDSKVPILQISIALPAAEALARISDAI